MIPNSVAPGIVIRAPDKTSARESEDEATSQRQQRLRSNAASTRFLETGHTARFFSLLYTIDN